MLPWSVMPSAGWPSAAAAATTSPIRAAPSSIENSVCTCRWVNEFAIGAVLLLSMVDVRASSRSTGAVHRVVPKLWTTYTRVISPRGRL